MSPARKIRPPQSNKNPVESNHSVQNKAQEDQKLKSFCQAASHELGNVLGTIVGELDYGLTNTNTLVRYRAMNVALAAAERAISLARNLAYFAINNKLDIRPVDASQLVLDTIEIVEKDLRNRHIKFNVLIEAARTVAIDPGALQQVLLNLFRRSSETMPQGGSLTVSMRSHGNKVEIVCKDTGVGIPHDRLEAFLDPSYNPMESALHVQGLELAVAKTLVERQGGEIRIESTQGEGTKYTLTFPFSAQSTQPKAFTELRRHRRIRASLPVEIAFNGSSPAMSEIQTLSVKGCFVQLLEAEHSLPAIDSMGGLRIYYYQDQVLDIAKCRIANHSREDGRTGVGIEFVEFDSRARKLLEAIVKSHSL